MEGAVVVRAPECIGRRGRGVVLSDCNEVLLVLLAQDQGACVLRLALRPWGCEEV